MKNKKSDVKCQIEPKSKVLVSCRDKSGRKNALVVAYCCNCSYDPPMVMVGIVPSRFSYGIIKETGCFIVNLVTEDYKEVYDYLGSVSGRDEDKFKEKDIRCADGENVNAPILLDCPVNIECEVIDSIMTGSHEMFVGKIVKVHADTNLVCEDGKVDVSKLKFV